MLPKTQRINIGSQRKKPEQTLHSPHFTLKVFPKEGEERAFGMVLKKNLLSQATKRNVLKRIFFEYGGSVKERLPQKDFLLVLKQNLKTYTKPEIKKELQELFSSLLH